MTPSVHRLREAAVPYMEDLYEGTHHTVHLAVMHDHEVLYVDKLSGHRKVTSASRVGGRLPLHSTGVGKALLAHADLGVVERVLSAGLAPFTRRTISSPPCLREELADVRRRGVAIDRGEHDPYVACLAAPVFRSGRVTAAVSVTGTRSRFIVDRSIYAVRAAAQGITHAIGSDEAS